MKNREKYYTLEQLYTFTELKYGTVDLYSTQIGRMLREVALETAGLRIAVGLNQEEDRMVITPQIEEPSSIGWVHWYFRNIAHMNMVAIYPIPDIKPVKEQHG